MTSQDTIKINISNECLRIEEDTTFSAKGHFNAEARWGKGHLFLGVLTSLLAGWAGFEFVGNSNMFASIIAFLAASFAIINTALNPEAVSNSHGVSAREYKALQNKTRLFREIDLPSLEANEASNKLKELAEQRDSLNQSSRGIPSWAYKTALKEIERGAASYIADKAK